MKHMRIYYDVDGDFLEVRFGRAVASYYDDLGNDVFVRRSEKSGKRVGYAIFNVQKRHLPRELKVALPV